MRHNYRAWILGAAMGVFLISPTAAWAQDELDEPTPVVRPAGMVNGMVVSRDSEGTVRVYAVNGSSAVKNEEEARKVIETELAGAQPLATLSGADLKGGETLEVASGREELDEETSAQAYYYYYYYNYYPTWNTASFSYVTSAGYSYFYYPTFSTYWNGASYYYYYWY